MPVLRALRCLLPAHRHFLTTSRSSPYVCCTEHILHYTASYLRPNHFMPRVRLPPLFCHYFTVISYNHKFFPGESVVSYIYNESNSDTIDTVESVIDLLLHHYNWIYGDVTIEAIRTTGKIYVSKLPRDKCFIQVIPFDPNFKRNESATRLSVYEQNHSIYRFSHDHIYIPQHESLYCS